MVEDYHLPTRLRGLLEAPGEGRLRLEEVEVIDLGTRGVGALVQGTGIDRELYLTIPKSRT